MQALVWAFSRKTAHLTCANHDRETARLLKGKFSARHCDSSGYSRKTAGEQGSKSAPKGKRHCTEKPHEEGPAASAGATASKPATTPRQTSIVAWS